MIAVAGADMLALGSEREVAEDLRTAGALVRARLVLLAEVCRKDLARLDDARLVCADGEGPGEIHRTAACCVQAVSHFLLDTSERRVGVGRADGRGETSRR